MRVGTGRRVAAGFTLIELLAVIGIIGILVGLLMPALGRARKEALRVACQSNMRDVGVHLQIYSNQWKGWMFPPGLGANRPEEKRWPVHVFQNARWDPQILKCPADDPHPVNEHSYLLNDNLTKRAIRNHTTHTDTGTPATEIVLLGEKVTTEDDYYMNPEVKDFIGVVEYYRHGANQGSNYLFLDGHVETVPPNLANTYIDPWDPIKPVPKAPGKS